MSKYERAKWAYKNMFERLRKKREETLRQNTPRECNYCRKHGTMECPNSFYCYSTDDKPHFEPR